RLGVERLDLVPVEARAALEPQRAEAQLFEEVDGGGVLDRWRRSRLAAGREVLPAEPDAGRAARERAEVAVPSRDLAGRRGEAEFGADDAAGLELAMVVVGVLAVELEGGERTDGAVEAGLAVEGVALHLDVDALGVCTDETAGDSVRVVVVAPGEAVVRLGCDARHPGGNGVRAQIGVVEHA